MADDFNNDTGRPGADGKPDDQASANAKAAMRAYTSSQGNGIPATSLTDITGDPTGGVTIDANGNLLVNGVPAITGKKDDTFPVRIGSSSNVGTYQTGQVPSEWQGTTVPFHTLTKDGFLGVTDQGIIDRVVSAADGKTKLFDKVYLAAVDKAALEQKSGKDVSVYDILDQWRKGGLPSNVSSDGSGGAYSSTNRVISLTDEGSARRLLNSALTGYLGRTATDDENKAFLKALNLQERENPSVTKTTGYSSGRNTTQQQMVTGGMDKNDFADRFAKSQQGYAEYQAATTYLDAFIGALKDNSRVVG
jgi:hypothetical protein